MGVENNECVIATTWNQKAVEKIRGWVGELPRDEQEMFAFIPTLVNINTTVILGPDGSKKGWQESNHGKILRDQLIELIGTFDFDDGSNPFDWVEVVYGEFGQKVLRGNCKNCYSDEDYYDDPYT